MIKHWNLFKKVQILAMKKMAGIHCYGQVVTDMKKSFVFLLRITHIPVTLISSKISIIQLKNHKKTNKKVIHSLNQKMPKRLENTLLCIGQAIKGK
jgi:glucose-6-phosphate isomerase